MPITKTHITDKNYNQKVIQIDRPFVMVFSRKVCPYCRTVENYFDMIQNEYPMIEIFFVKSEDSPNLISKFQIRTAPVTYYFNQNKVRSSVMTGAGSIKLIRNRLDKINIPLEKKPTFIQKVKGAIYDKNKAI